MAESEQRRFDNPPSEGLEKPSPHLPDPLAQALHDVPAPAGLEQRMLAGLSLLDPPVNSRKGVARRDRRPSADIRDDPDGFPILPSRRGRLLSRRRWLTGAVAGGVGGALLGTYGWLRRPLREPVVSAKALRWTQRLEAGGEGGWRRVEYVRDLPLPIDGLSIPPQRWKYLETEFSSQTVVHRWNFGGERVYLFALKTWRSLSALPSAPPAGPPKNQTGAWVVAAWQADECLYVIAMPKSAEALYHELLQIPPSGLV